MVKKLLAVIESVSGENLEIGMLSTSVFGLSCFLIFFILRISVDDRA